MTKKKKAEKKKTELSQPPAKAATTSADEAVRVDRPATPKEISLDMGDPPSVEAMTVTNQPKLPQAAPNSSSGKRKYRVLLNCPTPRHDKSLVVEAEGEGEATTLFLQHNGISGSDHPITVTEVLKCH